MTITQTRVRHALVRSHDDHLAACAGGKSAALADLARADFNVPAFFTLAPNAFANGTLRDEAAQELATAIAELGDGPFAVRSSSAGEDGAEHSHAGQFLSLLNVAADGVSDAAEQVARSARADTVAAYRDHRGLQATGSEMAVIVQKMVDARCAGVAFSADPVSGRRDRVLISATSGLGDQLVGGEVDGETYILDRTGRVVERPAEEGVLSDDDLAVLFDVIIRVEAHKETPQDIEWAFEGDRLYLLQARPITTVLRPQVANDPAVTVFDNSNIVESYPGLVSPLTYSFAQYVYSRVYRTFMSIVGVDRETVADHGVTFDNMLGQIDGRVYYNLINWYRLLALLPGYRLNRASMETMMGVGEPLPPQIADGLAPPPATGLAKLGDGFRVLRTIGILAFQNWRLRSTIAAFEARLNSAIATPRTALEKLPLSELAHEHRRIESVLLDRWDAPLINDFLCMIAFGTSRRVMEKWCGQAGIELHNAMMIGQGDIISAEPPKRIAAMAELVHNDQDLMAALDAGQRPEASASPALAAAIDDYIDKFGDRCTEELKLESLTLHDDATPLLVSIAAAARRPAKSDGAPVVDGDRELARLFRNRPLRRWAARWLLQWASARVRDRENLRFERTRVFGHARCVFLAIGKQFHGLGVLEAQRDVFFLTVHEILGAIEGNAVSHDLAALVELRKSEAARNRALPDPGERVTVYGAAVSRPATVVQQSVDSDGTSEKTGTGCSAGIVRALARVVYDPRNETVQSGEVLVARHTDPGWIALFANASGIVVERGSLLSHSAIVAREMGIPCVVGLKGATDWLNSGDLVEIDGAAGSVRIVSDAD